MLQASTSANSLEELKRESADTGLAMKAPPFFLKMAESMGVDHKELWVVLKATAFKGGKENGQVVPPTNEQMYALMMVANAYGLNPFTKEIYAFPDKQNGIIPVVGVDGWLRIANSNPAMDGYEVRSSEKLVKMDDDAKACPEWMEGVVYRKDRNRPIAVREYLDECYRPAFIGKYGKVLGPWQTHTKRMLRHKALIQSFRTTFGFAGVYEEDEAQRIIGAKVIDVTPMLEEGPDTSEFDLLAQEAGVATNPDFQTFLGECAKANGRSLEGLKQEGAKDFQNIMFVFGQWSAKRNAEEPIPRTTNHTTRADMQTRRENTKAELEDMGVFDQVAAEMGRKGQGPWTAWDSAKCQKALDMGRGMLEAKQSHPAQDAPTDIICPNLDGAARPRTDCDACASRAGCPEHKG